MSVSANLSGIGSILGSDCEVSSKTPASLRRTLSADMSSMKWMREQGFSLLRKVASSKQLQTLSEIDPSDDKMKKAEDSDLWSSIMSSQKSLPSSLLSSPPYVHPLTKRSRSLSQKSLEICTENLGSETGSDGFSSYSPSEGNDGEQDQEENENENENVVGEKEIIGEQDQEEMTVGEKEMMRKKTCTRSFPPPIPSLSLQMKSRRQDGRLVLEAVPVPAPSQSCFQAKRTNGRLLLTFLNSSAEDEVEENDENNVEEIAEIDMYEEPKRERFKDKDEIEDEAEEDQEIEEMVHEEKTGLEKEEKLFSMEVNEPRRNLPTGAMNVHRLTLMVNKLTNRNSTSNPSNNKFDTKDKEVSILPQSLPPVLRMTGFLPASAATSFNTYNYFWRNWSAQSPTPTQNLTKNKVFSSNNINPCEEQKKLVLSRGNEADYSLVPSSRGCKEARRSLLIPELHCIATS